jgi:hypothetical protein
MESAMTLFAQENDIITCEGGHPLYRIKSDIPRQTAVLRSENFERIDEQMPEPIKNTLIEPKCQRCGTRWFKEELGFPRIHFEDGWR